MKPVTVIQGAIAVLVVLLIPGLTVEVAAAATFTVNSTDDRVDTQIGNGQCRASNGRCTLRAAIQEANASSTADTILLQRATYQLALAPGTGGSAGGDLDVTAPVAIVGEGTTRTILDGGRPPSGSPPEVRGIDRLLEVHPSAGDVSLSALTVREGYSALPGGGIATASPGVLRLTTVNVTTSYSAKHGGGMSNDGPGRVELIGSTLVGNGAKESGSALTNEASGSVRIGPNSTVRDNPGSYPIGGAAILNHALLGARGSIEVVQSTVSDNLSRADGAGISNDGEGSILVDRSTLSRNTAEGNGGAIYNVSGSVTVTGTAPGLLGSTIADNNARSGGGIYNVGRPSSDLQRPGIDIARSTLSGNVAEGLGGGGGAGGAVFNDLEGDLSLTDVILTGNVAAADGGGVSSQHKASTTVAGGTVAGNLAGEGGGGISAFAEGPLSVTSTLFTGNHAAGADGGGGLYTDGLGDVSVTGATFDGNSTAGDGGGAAIDSFGVVTVADTAFVGNSATGRGGGLADQGTTVTLARLTVTGNTATEDGGGIDNKARGTLDLVDSSISGNTGQNGGGLANAADAVMTVSRTSFRGNVARASGGAVHNNSDAALTIERSTLADNVARASGGAVFSNSDAAFAITSSTLSGNDASASGGALYNDSDAGLEIANSTLSGNTAGVSGGAVFSDANGSLTVANATVAGNAAPLGSSFSHREGLAATLLTLRNTIVAGSAPAANCNGAVASEGGNLDSGSSCGLTAAGDLSDTDPRLEGLADNGGDTATHALAPDSPAIDAAVDPCPATDQRGSVRPLGLACDSGAFEAAPPPPDVTPPDTAITGGPGATDDGQATFSFTGTDDRTPEAALAFECRLDDGAWEPCVSPQSYANLGDGEHIFAVRALDRAGNADPLPASRTWSPDPGPDVTPPVAMIDEADEATARFAFSAADDRTAAADLRLECRLDGGDWAPCTSPATLSGLVAGTHTFEVRATDEAGNTGEPASHTWVILADTTPPETSIGDGPADPSEETTARFTFTATDDRSPVAALSFECRLDGSDWAPCTSPVTRPGLAPGPHTFDVRATDEAGNTGAASRAWTILPDTKAPIATIGDRPGDGNSPNARFTFAGSDDRTAAAALKFECRLDGSDWAACASPVTHGELGAGAHTFEVRATDEAGNTGEPATHTWTITPPAACPETMTAAADADSWIDENSGFSNKGTDSILKLQSKGPADNYRVLVRFALDFEALPAGCVVSSATLRLYASSATLGRSLAALRVDSPWAEETVSWRSQPRTTGPAAVTGSDFGYREWNVSSHVRAVQAGAENNGFLIRDTAEGDLGPAQSFHSREKGDGVPELVLTLAPAASPDGIAPETTIDSGPGSSGPSATFTFSSTDAGATYECSLDGAAFEECFSPKEYKGLAVGAHELKVRAKDAGGDADATPASRSWTVASRCAGSTATAVADADAWVSQGSPADNKGDDSVLKVDSKSGSNHRALIRFALPARPLDCAVATATLRLYTGSYKEGRSIEALRLDGNWTEDLVTWNSQPTTSGAAATAPSPTAPGYVEWTVTEQVADMYSGTNDGFLIRDATEDGPGLEQAFFSRDNSGVNPPQLVVSFAGA